MSYPVGWNGGVFLFMQESSAYLAQNRHLDDGTSYGGLQTLFHSGTFPACQREDPGTESFPRPGSHRGRDLAQQSEPERVPSSLATCFS